MILGIPYLIWIALAVYAVATVLVTEVFKKWINVEPLILSWVVGGAIYWILFWLMNGKLEGLEVLSVVAFIIITAILNTSYRYFGGFKKLIRLIVRSPLI